MCIIAELPIGNVNVHGIMVQHVLAVLISTLPSLCIMSSLPTRSIFLLSMQMGLSQLISIKKPVPLRSLCTGPPCPALAGQCHFILQSLKITIIIIINHNLGPTTFQFFLFVCCHRFVYFTVCIYCNKQHPIQLISPDCACNVQNRFSDTTQRPQYRNKICSLQVTLQCY